MRGWVNLHHVRFKVIWRSSVKKSGKILTYVFEVTEFESKVLVFVCYICVSFYELLNELTSILKNSLCFYECLWKFKFIFGNTLPTKKVEAAQVVFAWLRYFSVFPVFDLQMTLNLAWSRLTDLGFELSDLKHISKNFSRFFWRIFLHLTFKWPWTWRDGG